MGHVRGGTREQVYRPGVSRAVYNGKDRKEVRREPAGRCAGGVRARQNVTNRTFRTHTPEIISSLIRYEWHKMHKGPGNMTDTSGL